jgi:transcriptional regulator with XRE-family HTH domain
MLAEADNKKSPRALDRHTGSRLRQVRLAHRMSQGALAVRVGVSFQAVQKYETGDTRLSASRLFEIAQVLEVSPAFFFEGYDAGPTEPAAFHGTETVPFDTADVRRLVAGYRGIPSEKLRHTVLGLVRTLGRQPDEDADKRS